MSLLILFKYSFIFCGNFDTFYIYLYFTIILIQPSTRTIVESEGRDCGRGLALSPLRQTLHLLHQKHRHLHAQKGFTKQILIFQFFLHFNVFSAKMQYFLGLFKL
jgi:hypothetical protein